MDTKSFNNKNFGKPRAVCEGIEREDCGSDYKTETNKLRNQLNASERKSESRLRQIDYLESVIRKRNAELKERKQLIHELRNEVRRLGKQVSDLSAEREDGDGRVVLTDRERQILDMWPRFEDGECVWFGDAVEACHNGAIIVEAIEFTNGKAHVKDAEDGDWTTSMRATRPLKRPSPKVLDADGVEIKFGDTVWCGDGVEMTVMSLVGELPGHVTTHSKIPPAMHSIDPKRLTHTRPDSWERLEEDALEDVCEYAEASSFGHIDASDCDTCRFYNEGDDLSCEEKMASDIIRRAKALAGASV